MTVLLKTRETEDAIVKENTLEDSLILISFWESV